MVAPLRKDAIVFSLLCCIIRIKQNLTPMESRHHRKAKALGGSNEPPNTIKVPHHKHEAFHILFGILSPREIAAELTKTWIDPAWELIAIPKANL